MSDAPSPGPEGPSSAPRRDFLAGCAACLLGAAAATPPIAAGIIVLTDPLRRAQQSESGEKGVWVKVCKLSQVATDGIPKRFKVVAEKVDAWQRSIGELGSIYLRRTNPTETPLALQAACPHVGCVVTYKAPAYNCPCHNSNFDLEGKRLDPEASPSPRDMDSLAVEVRDDSEVWVNFMNFKTATSDKEPL